MRARAVAAVVLGFLVAAPTALAGPSAAVVSSDLAFARAQLRSSAAGLALTAYPYRTTSTGAWETRAASWWTSGFYPGSLWLAYQDTADKWFRTEAERRQAGLESQKNNTSTHDVGFLIMSSYENGYRATGVDAYRQVVLTAARSLASRFSPVVGCTRSWDSSSSSNFTVIVDNMMNLELLFWAAAHGGDPAWKNMAISHALKTREQFLRPDGSTFHVVDFDPATGAVRRKRTVQGLSADSTWSRGQAWAVYGFTTAFRETRDSRLLDAARRTADYYVAHLPADKVPYWDFAAAQPGQPRDSSAAAIAASGLLELARLEPSASRRSKYRAAAGATLDSLSSSAYLAKGTASKSILLHGTGNKPAGDFDRGYATGDYYFIEALQRWRSATQPALRIQLAPRRDLAGLLRSGFPVRIRASAGGRAVVTLSLAGTRRLVLARRARRVARRKWVKVRLRPSRMAARRLRRARTVRARVSVKLVARDGRRAGAQRTVRFRREGGAATTRRAGRQRRATSAGRP
jgi:hypothetical protein